VDPAGRVQAETAAAPGGQCRGTVGVRHDGNHRDADRVAEILDVVDAWVALVADHQEEYR
jgi:hypothetical protein